MPQQDIGVPILGALALILAMIVLGFHTGAIRRDETYPPLETSNVLRKSDAPRPADNSIPWCWSPKVGLGLPCRYRSGELEA